MVDLGGSLGGLTLISWVVGGVMIVDGMQTLNTFYKQHLNTLKLPDKIISTAGNGPTGPTMARHSVRKIATIHSCHENMPGYTRLG